MKLNASNRQNNGFDEKYAKRSQTVIAYGINFMRKKVFGGDEYSWATLALL